MKDIRLNPALDSFLGKALVQSASVMIWISNTEKECVFFNQSWLKFRGRSCDQEYGYGWAEGVHPDDYDRCLDIFIKAFDRREEFSMDYRLQRSDGEYRWIRDDGAPYTDTDGIFAGYIGCCYDIHREIEALRSIEASEQLTRDREQEHISTLESMQVGVVVHASDTSILYANAAASDILGLSPDQLKGKQAIDPRWQFVYPNGQSMPLDAYPVNIAIVTRRDLKDYELGIVVPDSPTLTWVNVNARPLYTQNGQVKKIVVSFVDITERKQTEIKLQASEARLLAATSAAGIGIWEYDIETDELVWDDRMFELYGCRKENFVSAYGTWQSSVLADDLDVATRKLQRSIEKGTIFTAEFRVTHEDGSTHWISAYGHPLRNQDGRVIKMYGTNQNIDAVRDNERMLREALEKAEQSTKGLIDLARKRSLVYGMVAHELRTPISAISMMVDQDDDSSWLDHRPTVGKFTRDLLYTLDDMRLLVNPSRRREIRLDNFTLQELMNQIRASTASTVAATHFNFHADTVLDTISQTDLISCDMYRLKVAATNLVKNACLHSEGKNVWIRTRDEHRDNRVYLTLEVEDDGRGVSPDHIPNLFKPMERGITAAEGTGLGLYIARSWIEDIGGTLEYEPRSGGARFIVSVPIEIVEDKPSDQTEVHSAEGETKTVLSDIKSMRVLFAEDEATLRMLGQVILRKIFKDIDVAEDVDQGIEALGRDHHLILTDYYMPGGNGTRLIQTARERGFDGIIIGVTAATIGDQMAEMLSAGADGVIDKPLTSEKLLKTLDEILTRGRASRER